ncbi:MAG: ADP-ribosylglycohydrolase family protein [Enterobacter hormaechei]
MKQNRILGALYGQALGDAMGMPSELWPRKRVKAHFGWIDRFLPGPASNAACYFNQAEFTDDTSMALCQPTRLSNATEINLTLSVSIFWTGRWILTRSIRMCSARPQNCPQRHP